VSAIRVLAIGQHDVSASPLGIHDALDLNAMTTLEIFSDYV